MACRVSRTSTRGRHCPDRIGHDSCWRWLANKPGESTLLFLTKKPERFWRRKNVAFGSCSLCCVVIVGRMPDDAPAVRARQLDRIRVRSSTNDTDKPRDSDNRVVWRSPAVELLGASRALHAPAVRHLDVDRRDHRRRTDSQRHGRVRVGGDLRHRRRWHAFRANYFHP